MAKGYVIAQIDVREPGTYKRYVEMVGPIVASFGGAFLVRGGKAEHHEGTPTGERTVVIEFPSYEAARDWYHSDAYAEARALRMSASTSIQTIVEGVS